MALSPFGLVHFSLPLRRLYDSHDPDKQPAGVLQVSRAEQQSTLSISSGA
jgi:hypothetical protein